jgi:hypothetical protein
VVGAAALTAVLAGSAMAVEPVDTVVKKVENTTGVHVDTGPVVGGPGGGGGRGARGRSAVVGYIQIFSTDEAGTGHALLGGLSDPHQWACSGGGSGSSYSVTCKAVALPVVMDYHCDVLHADASPLSETGAARTSMDCDSDGVPEVQTALAQGMAGYEFKWSVDTRLVTEFTCTVDSIVPNVRAGCGDPGLVGVSL